MEEFFFLLFFQPLIDWKTSMTTVITESTKMR